MLAILAAFLSLGLVQEPAFTPDIQAAERALSAALEQHDRAAFERLIAPDATFFTPSLLQGREAIVQGWIPFLLNTGSTIVLERSRTTGHDDVIVTEGKFSITGAGPVRPVQNATFMAVWKRAAEGWLLYSFASGIAAPARPATPPAAAAGGLMDYHFGMTREQVRQVGACQPYLDVPITSGLECPNFTFEGKKMNISFIFAGPALRRIQLWFYEGRSEKDAKKATDAAVAYLTREAGAVHSYELPAGAETSAEEIFKALKKMTVPPNQPVFVQLVTQSTARPEQLHARVARMPDDSYGVYVFVSAK